MVLEVDRIVTRRRLHLDFHPLADVSPPAALPR
jgi:hypothetical protein